MLPYNFKMTASGSQQSRVGWAVAAILLLDLLLFSPSFGNFFCGDSLYFLSRQGDELRQPARLFTNLDTLHSYRPLTHLVFDYLMYPLSGLDPRGYQLMVRALHLSAALLVFFLLRRLTRSPGAALLGLFFFAAHGENFYLNYDPSFLPDLLVGLFGVAALLAYAQGHRLASTLFFGLALLSKESALTLVVGLVVAGLLREREERQPLAGAIRAQLLALAPQLALAAAYLGFQIVMRHGLFPQEPGPYSLSMSAWTLWLKTKYLAWLFSIPADWERRRWWLLPPLFLMLPALVWLLGSLRNAWRRDSRPLLLCTAWAVASLAPVAAISQVPMKHNLQFSVLALAVALALSLGTRPVVALLPRSAWWLIVPMALSTAFQVRNDLLFSWVAEGSGVAERSLTAMQERYPTLPRGATLYLFPAVTRGNISWYFDGGSLFRLFYKDPTLEMRFANLKQELTPEAASNPNVLFFRFQDGDRLYDVTPEYRMELSDKENDWLLKRFDPAATRSAFDWPKSVLPQGRPVVLDQHVAGSTLRTALIMLPGTIAAFPVREIPANAALLIGLALAGKPREGAAARIWFESKEGKQDLYSIMLDPQFSVSWWDGDVDLRMLRGRSGTLYLENVGSRASDWLAWSRMRIVTGSSPYNIRTERGSQFLYFQDQRPYMPWLDRAQITNPFSWQPGDLMDGLVARPRVLERQGEKRLAFVMLPGTEARFPEIRPNADTRLHFALTLASRATGGARARVSIETAGKKHTLFETLVDNSFDGDVWSEGEVDLGRFAGQPAALVLENDADRVAAPIAWSNVTLAHYSQTATPSTSRHLLEHAESAPIEFDRTEVYPDYEHFDTPNGKPAFLQWTSYSRPYRLNLVTAAGARVRFTVPALPRGAVLQVSATHGATLGDGAVGRIYWEQNGRRELLFERMVYPRQSYWYDRDIPLAPWAGQAGVLCFEASSGPKHNTVGDWLAWGRMRIVW